MTAAALVAAVAGACSAMLVAGGRGRPLALRRGGPDVGPSARPRGRAAWWWPVLVGSAVGWLGGPVGGPVAGVVAGVGTVAVRRQLALRRRARARGEASARAVEACVVLADEVRAGQAVVHALASAAEVDPVVEAACAAAAVGADVPGALRRAGGEEYRFLAAAWQVSERHGGGLATALDRVVAQARADRATARVVSSELASARSTARLLVALPLFALLVGAGSGGRPWEFLLQTTPGAVCLALGGLLAWAGLAWIDAIAAGAA